MVDVQPFRGLRYNADKVGDLQAVIAPPYDVISEAHQETLYERHPNNVVRLILGKKDPTDNGTTNVYTRAAEALKDWGTEGVLQSEGSLAFYGYTQTWQGVERKGFLGRLQLEAFESKQVLPHEYTLGGPKADRLALMKATGSVLSPIFCLYDDPDRQIEEQVLEESRQEGQVLELTDDDGVVHTMWPITSVVHTQAIRNVMKGKQALIADGHHRYETALAYQAWRREEDGQEHTPVGNMPYDYTMAFFTNMADSGLKVYPTHRVLQSLPEGWTQETLLEAMQTCFEPVDNENEALFWVQAAGQPKVGYRLKADVDCSAVPEPMRELDVALLDQFVFQEAMQTSANDLKQAKHLLFIRDEKDVQAHVAKGSFIFWVHAPSVEMTRDICQSGYRMPQKSTYFYPKLLSGLVFYYYGT